MTAEGVFPKVNGDMLHASEVNGFYNSQTNIDFALNITPTASGWTTTPTNLANATDGNLSTSTGTGILNATSGSAYVTIDLGANLSRRGVSAVFTPVLGAYNQVQSYQYDTLNIEVSPDNSNWYTIYSKSGSSGSGWNSELDIGIFVTAYTSSFRYIRFKLTAQASGSGQATLPPTLTIKEIIVK